MQRRKLRCRKGKSSSGGWTQNQVLPKGQISPWETKPESESPVISSPSLAGDIGLFLSLFFLSFHLNQIDYTRRYSEKGSLGGVGEGPLWAAGEPQGSWEQLASSVLVPSLRDPPLKVSPPSPSRHCRVLQGWRRCLKRGFRPLPELFSSPP